VAYASEGSTLASVLWPIILGWIVALSLAIRRPVFGVLVSSVGGLLLSSYLSWQHLSKTDSAACNVGDLFNCSAVNTSSYGTLSGHLSFLPSIPLSFLGFAFYGAFLALGMAVLSDLSQEQEKLQAPAFIGFGKVVQLFGGLSIIFSAYLAYISKVHIGAWCLYCIGMYGFNLILFVAGVFWVRKNRNLEGGDSSMQTFLVPLGILSVLSLLVSSFVPHGDGDVVVQKGAWSIEKIEGGAILDGSEVVFGRTSTPYTVVEFADFQCGHCAQTTPKLKKVIGKFSDVVHLKYKHFPLSNTCNHNISGAFHEQSCQAAYVADCAGRQGKFWEMSKLLFINGSALSAQSFSFLAEQVKLDHASFDTCLNDASIKEGIQKDIQAADILNVEGTPALYLHDGVSWWKIDEHEVGLENTLILLKRGETPPGAQKKNPLGVTKEKADPPKEEVPKEKKEHSPSEGGH
jgi:uncharacterized membrane protein/predicted DsbA family dithiol-disulfide isomerase